MGRISDRFAKLAASDKRALVTFVTAGDPSLEALPAVLDTLADAGADLIELGIPFSDPIADGPSIQASSQRALDGGTTPARALARLKDWTSTRGDRPPIVLMGYYNPVLRAGVGEFARSAREAGADGVIVTDLIPEEASEWREAAAAEGLDSVFLAAPTSTDARLDLIAQASEGFVYAVSRTGVTGAEREVPLQVRALVERLRARTPKPICVGFGISALEHVAMVCGVADGAVVGSAIVDRLHATGATPEGLRSLGEFVASLAQATYPRK